LINISVTKKGEKMAKNNFTSFIEKPPKKRKGIHSKNKSRTKGGKQYKKLKVGQG
jgi:hypothetical protein